MATKQKFLLKPSDFEFGRGYVSIKRAAVARRFKKLLAEAKKRKRKPPPPTGPIVNVNV